MEPIQVTYNPRVFDVGSIDDAMRIILTPEGATTEHRWATETPYLADLIAGTFALTEQSLVLDYGCGIGRLAKALIARHGCRVIGVDISTNMRALGAVYVASDRFFACSADMLDVLVARGLRCDLALTVWVLQHCLRVGDDIARIAGALQPNGELFVVNQLSRAVPTVERGWVDDKVDLDALLQGRFTLRAGGALDAQHTTEVLSQVGSWRAFRLLR